MLPTTHDIGIILGRLIIEDEEFTKTLLESINKSENNIHPEDREKMQQWIELMRTMRLVVARL